MRDTSFMTGDADASFVLPSRAHEGRRTPRGVAILLLVLVPALAAGCLGPDAPSRDYLYRTENATGASDFVVPPPAAAEDDAPDFPEDPSPDPRLNLSAPWKRGDKWYYESNVSQYIRVTVLGFRRHEGVPHYVVRTETGHFGNPPHSVSDSTITPDFRITNITIENGIVRYAPASPAPRFLPRYGTFEVNETGEQTLLGHESRWRNVVRVLVAETRPLTPTGVPAGVFDAAHFSVYSSIIKPGRSGQNLVVSERWYSPDVLNDVAILSNANKETAELFKLIYFERDGKVTGTKPAGER